MRYWLGLGSNEGDSASNLTEAVRRLKAEGIRIVGRSPVYRTEPVGIKDQAWFLNQALEISTGLVPSVLLRKAKKIEKAMGRKPGPKNGPRPIDIDILLAEGAVVRTAALEIPHPRLAERRFALVPLARIAPDRIHPLLKKRIRTILRDCRDTAKVARMR
jgi:2-amino-4-hydroxy-6-hydroxymethyldihydropteridine diphosphokinase